MKVETKLHKASDMVGSDMPRGSYGILTVVPGGWTWKLGDVVYRPPGYTTDEIFSLRDGTHCGQSRTQFRIRAMEAGETITLTF